MTLILAGVFLGAGLLLVTRWWSDDRPRRKR